MERRARRLAPGRHPDRRAVGGDALHVERVVRDHPEPVRDRGTRLTDDHSRRRPADRPDGRVHAATDAVLEPVGVGRGPGERDAERRRAALERRPGAGEVDDRGADRGQRPREADLREAPLRVDEGRRQAAVEPADDRRADVVAEVGDPAGRAGAGRVGPPARGRAAPSTAAGRRPRSGGRRPRTARACGRRRRWRSTGRCRSRFVLTVLDVHVEPLDDWSRTPDPALRKAIRGWPAASTAIDGLDVARRARRALREHPRAGAVGRVLDGGRVGRRAERLEREVGVAGRVEGDRGVRVLGGRRARADRRHDPAAARRSWRRRFGSCRPRRRRTRRGATRSRPARWRGCRWRPRPRAS